jgi:hypothetical protein
VPGLSRGTAGHATRRALALGAVVAVLGLFVSGRPSISLYDGVVPLEPYVYLDPAPGQPGNPKGATATLDLNDGQNPLIAVATPELVPQAQLFAIPGSLVVPAGTTKIDVSIAAVEPPALPTEGHIGGNVYAITVTNQAGAPLTADATAQVSIILRAPDPLTATATVVRFDGTSWVPLKTDPSGLGATFTAVVTQFGDFAVLLPGPAPSGAPSPGASAGEPSSATPSGPSTSPAPGGLLGLDRQTLTFVLGGVAVVIVALVAAVALLPSRRGPPTGRSGGGRGGGAGRPDRPAARQRRDRP